MAAPALEMDAGSLQLGRARYLKMLVALAPVARVHLDAMTGRDVRSALIGIDLLSPGILHLLERYLDSGQATPNQRETIYLTHLLLAINHYLSLRGLFAESLRWGIALLQHYQAHGWEYAPTLLVHISKAYSEADLAEEQIAFATRLLTTELATNIKASLHMHLNISYFRKRAYAAALEHATHAYDLLIAEAEPSDIGCAQAAMDAFSALVALKLPQDADDCAVVALHHAIQSGDPFQTAAALLIKAQAHTLMKRYSKALPLYEIALEFFTEMNHLPHRARTQFCLAVYHHLTGNPVESRRLALESRDLFERFAMRVDYEEAQALLRILGG